jgi:tRNA-specific 2-thiouridylase
MKVYKDKVVMVGLSGGVDSSVAVLRLLKEGYTVVGVFIKVWHPDFLECNWEQERLDAMRVAAKLQIPFLTCDAQQAYKNDVADYFIQEYKEGRTPNPDVMCNKHVKFGTFFDFAMQHNADYIATGHYAQVQRENDAYRLYRGVDEDKDQSYFLWTLTQDQLSKVLLPVGNSKKSSIRNEAKNAGLITAQKKDSQGICFLGHVDIPEFLSHYIDLKVGEVLNTEGQIIGTHNGAFVYTNGQRHGFSISINTSTRTPYYVVDRNIQANTITVSNKKPVINKNSSIKISHVNYIDWEPKIDMIIAIQTRYRQKTSLCTVTSVSADTITLSFTEEAEEVSSGQSCVFYDGMRCCGGGIII